VAERHLGCIQKMRHSRRQKRERASRAHATHRRTLAFFQKYNANHNDSRNNHRVMVNNCDNKDHGRIPEHDEADSYWGATYMPKSLNERLAQFHCTEGQAKPNTNQAHRHTR